MSKTCSHCGGSNLQIGIQVVADHPMSGRLVGDAGIMGLIFSTWGGLNSDVEPIYADLCKDCGTIVRLYVKDYQSKKWE